MGEQIVQQQAKFSFLKNHFFSYQISRALTDCRKIEEYLLSKDSLSKFDSRLNLLISNGFKNEIVNNYFLYKGYNTDGSITPIIKYNIIDGEIVKCINVINKDIIVLDLYEESIYLHSYLKDSHYITGYLIKEKIKSKLSKTLIFSNERIKINIKNINEIHTMNVVDDFVNAFII